MCAFPATSGKRRCSNYTLKPDTLSDLAFIPLFFPHESYRASPPASILCTNTHRLMVTHWTAIADADKSTLLQHSFKTLEEHFKASQCCHSLDPPASDIPVKDQGKAKKKRKKIMTTDSTGAPFTLDTSRCCCLNCSCWRYSLSIFIKHTPSP